MWTRKTSGHLYVMVFIPLRKAFTFFQEFHKRMKQYGENSPRFRKRLVSKWEVSQVFIKYQAHLMTVVTDKSFNAI